jgi:signal transduction histidine kinase
VGLGKEVTGVPVADSGIPLRRSPLSLPALLQAIQDLMQPQAKALDVTLRVAVERNAPQTVFADRRKIAWAITALIGNALRYVRHGTGRMPGGSISVTATPDPETGDAALEIQDDGPGIPEDTVRATDTDVDNPRAGLALAMVRDVILAHGGTLAIRSRTDAVSHGTTIRFTLPVS